MKRANKQAQPKQAKKKRVKYDDRYVKARLGFAEGSTEGAGNVLWSNALPLQRFPDASELFVRFHAYFVGESGAVRRLDGAAVQLSSKSTPNCPKVKLQLPSGLDDGTTRRADVSLAEVVLLAWVPFEGCTEYKPAHQDHDPSNNAIANLSWVHKDHFVNRSQYGKHPRIIARCGDREEPFSSTDAAAKFFGRLDPETIRRRLADGQPLQVRPLP